MMSSNERRVHRVLLVDDDPLVVKVYAERMRYEGWTVAIARDGWEASQEAKRDHFDAILLDIRMPFHDGLDVLREIRNGARNPETPVWILTGLSTGDEIEDSLRLGADGVFHKSSTRPDDLVRELEKIFRSGPSRAVPEPVAATASVAAGEHQAVEDALDRILGEEDVSADPAASAGSAPAPAPASAPPDPAAAEAPVRRLPVRRLPVRAPAVLPREFTVYVNPFLGEGADLARALGIEPSYQCPACAGQLRLLLGPGADGERLSARFVCSQCEEEV